MIWFLSALVVAVTTAVPLSYCCRKMVRRARERKRTADLEAEAAELRREVENLELIIARLDALDRDLGYNVSRPRAEAQKALEELRRGEQDDA